MIAVSLLFAVGITTHSSVAFAGGKGPSAKASASGEGTGIASIYQEGAEKQVYYPAQVQAPVVGPNLFGLNGTTTEIASLSFEIAVQRHVRPDRPSEHFKGKSGLSLGTVTYRDFSREDLPERAGKTSVIGFRYFGQAVKGYPVAVLKSWSNPEKPGAAQLMTLQTDAAYKLANMSPFKGHDLVFVSIPKNVVSAIGVSTETDGVSLGAAVSGFLGKALGGGSGAISDADGSTAPFGQIGATWVVFVASPDAPERSVIAWLMKAQNDLADFQVHFPSPKREESSHSSNNGKKYEGSKSK